MMKRSGPIRLAAALAATIASAGVAEAGLVTTFTSEASFNASAGSLTDTTYGSLTPTTNTNYLAEGAVLNGNTYTGDFNYLYAIQHSGSQPFIYGFNGDANAITIQLAPGTFAVGGNIGGFNSTPGTIKLSYMLADATTGSVSEAAPGFLGITSGTAIKSVVITNTNDYAALFDLEFGPGSALATPEPSTLISGGIACLAGLGWGWRRRRARAVA